MSNAAPELRAAVEEKGLAALAIRTSNWSEKWFPNSLIFALLVVVIVSIVAMSIGSPPAMVAQTFGGGFWDLIPFTMQMAMVTISGYVVAESAPVRRLIIKCAQLPSNGRQAVALVATLSMTTSFLNWGLSLIFSGLLVRRMAERQDMRMDYRAAAAAGYLGLGATWALGLSSSAAQLQANPGSLPESLIKITGVIPFWDTIFTWQSLTMFVVITVMSIIIAYVSAPKDANAKVAADLGVDPHDPVVEDAPATRPGEWLERSPLLTIVVLALVLGWVVQEFAGKDPIIAISGLNTYNLIFLSLGMALHWRPARFIKAVGKAVPAVGGVLIQFPFYAGIAAIMTRAVNADDHSVSHMLSEFFSTVGNNHVTFPLLIAVYSIILGFLIPSGGGKWLIEAPYVMEAANNLQYPLGWTVQIYNAAEAIPNLINPFWMLPLLGVVALRARDVVGFTFIQLLFHLPVVLILLVVFGLTLPYHPPVIP